MSNPRLTFVRLTDTDLHYSECGAGDPVVLVHGGLADYRLWGRLSGVLSKNFRVIAYSRRGAFPNAPSKRGSSVALHSADLSSLISQLSDGPTHLVGESYGAYVALHCALHHPEVVRSLAIDEPPALPLLSEAEEDRTDLASFESKMLKPVLGHFGSGSPEEAARLLVDFLEGTDGIYDSLPPEVKKAIGDNSQATFDDLKGGLDGIRPDELGLLKTPTLLMKSELGPTVLKRVVDRLHERIPNGVLRVIRGTSHGTIVDSAEYSAAVLEFVSRN